MVGKKKTRDVQFYREASEAAFDETGNRKRRRQYGDDDEIEAEQDERRKRAELNRHFKAFADKIAEASDGRLEVDIPYRELGFQGVPSRSNVLMQPTTDCLVHLVEPPFLVITLAEVEVAHLERVQYGLKNFDLVFVLKDFKQNPITVLARSRIQAQSRYGSLTRKLLTGTPSRPASLRTSRSGSTLATFRSQRARSTSTGEPS